MRTEAGSEGPKAPKRKDSASSNMKAVSMIFEFALLFMFGIIIFISCVSVFINYKAYFSTVGVNDQLSKITDYVDSNIIKLAEEGSGEESKVELKIPKRIGTEGGGIFSSIVGEEYTMELSSNGLTVESTATKVSKHSPIYNITQSYSLIGKAASGAGTVIIFKTGNQIILY